MRSVPVAERRARLGVRHALAAPVATPLDAARAVVALHATDPAAVFLSAVARCPDTTVAAVEDALYTARTLLRLRGMRRTMFVVPVDAAPAVRAASAPVIDASRRTYVKLLASAGVGDEGWLADVMDSVAAALSARGAATAAELGEDEPRLRTRVAVPGPGDPPAITSWVLSLLASDGRIARGRPNGSWLSSRWQWTPMDAWLPGGLKALPVEEARADLTRRWLAAYGPATPADLRWWTGWTARQAGSALAAVGAVDVDLDGVPGVVLPGDEDPVAAPDPWVALLPALDPTAMGWGARDWYLDDRSLYDRSGNLGPTVWCDGRIVGGWAQRPGGEIVHRLFADVGAEATAEVDAAAGRLAGWLGDARPAVRGRARCPFERDLLGA